MWVKPLKNSLDQKKHKYIKWLGFLIITIANDIICVLAYGRYTRVRWLIFPTSSNTAGSFLVVCHLITWETLVRQAVTVTSPRLVVFFPLCKPCWNCSALTQRILPACPHATVAVVCYLTVRLFFSIWACLQPAPASFCLLSGPFTNAHWLRTARSVDLSWPDFKKRWLGTTPTRNPALRQGFPCSVLWFSCQALIQIRLLKWLMSDHSIKTLKPAVVVLSS